MIWREIKRQIYLKKIILIQILLTIFILIVGKNNFDNMNFFIYIPLFFSYTTQNDIFFYDMNNCIETLISTPLKISKILKNKSLFIILKSYFFSIVFYILYIFLEKSLFDIKNIWNIENLKILILVFLIQYFFSIFIGALVWNLGKNSRIILIIIQSILFSILNMYNKKYYIYILLLTLVIMYILGNLMIKLINKENLIKRSI